MSYDYKDEERILRLIESLNIYGYDTAKATVEAAFAQYDHFREKLREERV